MIEIAVGQTIHRFPDPENTKQMIALCGRPNVRYLQFYGSAPVNRARSVIATWFLGSDAEVLLTLDDDIIFRPDDVLSLCEQAVEYDVVAALYPTRGKGSTIPTSRLRLGVVYDMTDPTPQPIDYAAAGCTAIHRRVLERLAKDMTLHNQGTTWAFYPFYYELLDTDGIMLSEDWAFSYRVWNAGFGVYCNPAVRLMHVGRYAFSLDEMGESAGPSQRLLEIERDEGGYRTKMGTLRLREAVLA